VLAESACLNQKPILFEGAVSDAKMPVGLTGEGLELSVLKKAEKEDVWIIRIVETTGRQSTGSLELNGSITECDLMELKDMAAPKSVKSETQISLTPFDIKTYKIKY
jgi:alpha-mannosidase